MCAMTARAFGDPPAEAVATADALLRRLALDDGTQPMVQIGSDSGLLAAPVPRQDILIAPGERYDVLWEAREPGKWLLHCHIAHHTTNNNVEVEGGGHCCSS
mgnify:CR=1 FL=1